MFVFSGSQVVVVIVSRGCPPGDNRGPVTCTDGLGAAFGIDICGKTVFAAACVCWTVVHCAVMARMFCLVDVADVISRVVRVTCWPSVEGYNVHIIIFAYKQKLDQNLGR